MARGEKIKVILMTYSYFIFSGDPDDESNEVGRLNIMSFNLVPRVFRLFGQRLVARRHSGVLEFYYLRISAVKQCQPLRVSQSKEFSRVSSGAQPLANNSEIKGI